MDSVEIFEIDPLSPEEIFRPSLEMESENPTVDPISLPLKRNSEGNALLTIDRENGAIEQPKLDTNRFYFLMDDIARSLLVLLFVAKRKRRHKRHPPLIL